MAVHARVGSLLAVVGGVIETHERFAQPTDARVAIVGFEGVDEASLAESEPCVGVTVRREESIETVDRSGITPEVVSEASDLRGRDGERHRLCSGPGDPSEYVGECGTRLVGQHG